MNKKLIRLTEADLHKIVKESIGKVFNQVGLPTTTYHDAFDQMEKESSREDTNIYFKHVEEIREKALGAIETLNDCAYDLRNRRDPRLNKKYYDDLVRKIHDLKPYFAENSPLVLSFINYKKDEMRRPKRDEDWEPED